MPLAVSNVLQKYPRILGEGTLQNQVSKSEGHEILRADFRHRCIMYISQFGKQTGFMNKNHVNFGTIQGNPCAFPVSECDGSHRHI
jgi:hypothetical protein